MCPIFWDLQKWFSLAHRCFLFIGSLNGCPILLDTQKWVLLLWFSSKTNQRGIPQKTNPNYLSFCPLKRYTYIILLVHIIDYRASSGRSILGETSYPARRSGSDRVQDLKLGCFRLLQMLPLYVSALNVLALVVGPVLLLALI